MRPRKPERTGGLPDPNAPREPVAVTMARQVVLFYEECCAWRKAVNVLQARGGLYANLVADMQAVINDTPAPSTAPATQEAQQAEPAA